MISVFPSYYPDFACIASQCRHSCCIGWEIDIDKASLERYSAVEGPMGRRLREAIDLTGTPHFRLGQGERCPFLNRAGLCDLYRELGEDALCGICSDHPRFRTFLPHRTETGLGLCCEEAARLILSQTEPVRLLRRGRAPEKESRELRTALRLRRRMLRALQDRAKPLPQRLEEALALCGGSVSRSARGWADFYRGLERLDGGWDAVLDSLARPVDEKGFARHMAGRESEYEQLAVYFVYRHLLAGEDRADIPARGAFAVLSTRLLYRAGAVHWTETGEFTLADQVELARMYSSEIEYSEENMAAVLAALTE